MRLRFRIRTSPQSASGTMLDRIVEAEAAGGELRVGRRAGVEVALPFPTVSGLHARILRHAGGWAVADLGSANGTFVGPARLVPGAAHPLRRGESVRLADVSLTFEGEVGGEPDRAEGAPPESTATLARRLVSDLFQAMAGAEVPRIVVRSGPSEGEALALAQPDRVYRVGRAPDCDLVLPDEDVSREHAAFERRWEGIYVRDLGSKNGVEVAGERLRGPRRLHDGEALVIGGTVLRADDPEERYLRRMEDEPEAAPQEPWEPEAPGEDVDPALPHAAAPGAGRREGRTSRVPALLTAFGLLVLAGVGYFAWSLIAGGSMIGEP